MEGVHEKSVFEPEILCSWRRLGASWGRLGRVLGPSWGRLGSLGASWERLGAVLRRLVDVWGRISLQIQLESEL